MDSGHTQIFDIKAESRKRKQGRQGFGVWAKKAEVQRSAVAGILARQAEVVENRRNPTESDLWVRFWW
jgi:hypothetical protein